MQTKQKWHFLDAFVRDSGGAAAIELAVGAAALLAAAVLCFDLYARVSSDTAGLRLAVTMADYVSRDTAPKGADLTALGEFLHEQELGVPADLAYVLTALRRQAPADAPPEVEVLWSDASIRIGDGAEELADECGRYVDDGGDAVLPANFVAEMEAGEVIVVAEVCARLLREGSFTGKFIGDVIYGNHALPIRDPTQPPSAPVFVKRRPPAGTDPAGARLHVAPGAPGVPAGLCASPVARA